MDIADELLKILIILAEERVVPTLEDVSHPPM